MNRRIFSTDGGENKGVHVVGNGRMCAYLAGPEMIQIFGAPYSLPAALSMRLAEDEVVLAESFRQGEDSAAIRHEMAQGEYTDCAAADGAYLMRHWSLRTPMRWRLGGFGYPIIGNTGEFAADATAFLVSIPAGSPVYNWYPSRDNRYMQILLVGGCRAELVQDELLLTLSGEGEMIISGGDYPECREAACRALRRGWLSTLEASDADTRHFLKERRARQTALRPHPLAEAVTQAADDIALLIRAQQDAGGGVLAGTNYHLGYVRDQYGVSRGFLKMGCWEEAKKILTFYRDVFAQNGKICNAQGMGQAGMFHVHENDSVEITGYLIRQAFDVLETTGDRELFESLRPMLDWAFWQQANALHQGMLPFNGDETYVAGGVLPRHVLNDGSLEATMLFVTSGDRYAQFLPAAERARAEALLGDTRRRFPENFRRLHGWVTNSRKRLEGLIYPEYRHGVCMAYLVGGGMHFGWTRHVGGGWYLCPECARSGITLPEMPETEYMLKPVALMAPYMQCDLLPEAYVQKCVQAYLEEYRRTGNLPSRPEGDRCLGYDFGLLLYAAKKYGLPADDLLGHMLALRDDCGAWVEYYDGGKPAGTPCRPWESGINIEAALDYLSL